MNLIENQLYKVYGKEMVFEKKEEKSGGKIVLFFDKQTFVKYAHELDDFYQNVEIINLDEIKVNQPQIIGKKLDRVAVRDTKNVMALDAMSEGLFEFFNAVKGSENLTKEQIAKGNLMAKISETVAKNELTKLAIRNRG
jgi:hypothetical protein